MLDAYEAHNQFEEKRKCRQAYFNVEWLGLLDLIFLTMTDNCTFPGRQDIAIPVHVVAIRQSEYEWIANWLNSDDWGCVVPSTSAAHTSDGGANCFASVCFNPSQWCLHH